MLLWFGLTLGILMAAFGFATYSSIKGTVIPLTHGPQNDPTAIIHYIRA